MSGLTQAGGGKYLNITAGRIRQTVDKDTEGAKMREWETKDGKKGVKYELVFSKIEGVIDNIEFQDGDFGEQIKVTMICDREKYVLAMPSDSRYASDFMKRLPGVDFGREVTLTPYDVEDKGKKNTGVKIEQQGNVIRNFFWDYENKKAINGMPVMEEKNPDTDDWKSYFIQVKKFLKRVVNEKIVPKLREIDFSPKVVEKTVEKKHDDESSDLPF